MSDLLFAFWRLRRELRSETPLSAYQQTSKVPSHTTVTSDLSFLKAFLLFAKLYVNLFFLKYSVPLYLEIMLL